MSKDDLIHSHTARGFSLINFTDRYGVKCSLQKSSLAEDDAIWFGCDDIGLKRLVPGRGWTEVPMDSNTQANTRMHLTQEMVKALLPALIEFAETGDFT